MFRKILSRRKIKERASWQIALDDFKSNQQAILKALDEMAKTNMFNMQDSFHTARFRELVSIDTSGLTDKSKYSSWLIKLNMAYNALKRCNHHIGLYHPLDCLLEPILGVLRNREISPFHSRNIA